MKKNKSAFSLIIAMGLVLIMSLLVLYILEYIIPYSKSVKGIENSSNAFYQAENSIEETLYLFKNRGNSNFSDYTKPFGGSPIDYKYITTSSGRLIPPFGKGNSDFNRNYNIISQGNPIQLKIGKGVRIDWNHSNTAILFKVPEISSIIENLNGTNIINWQLSSETNNNTLNSTGSLITSSEINSGNPIDLSNKQGVDLEGNNYTFNNYYINNCYGTNSGCVLKMSIINKLELTNGTILPYLEYQFNFNSFISVPLRYSRIKSFGKSYGFQKDLEIKIPQQTTNQALDFTVFQ